MKNIKLPRRNETPVYSLARRVKSYIRGLRRGSLRKRMSSSFVTIGPNRYKRIRCKDDWTPIYKQQLLERVQESGFFPRVLMQYQNELWVEYIDGIIPLNKDMMPVSELGRFYSYLYSIDSQQVSVDAYLANLEMNLDFLRDIRFLSSESCEKLSRHREQITPHKVWVGLDYTDAILKNFVVRQPENSMYAIDIESLQDRKLLGTGLAKAHMRWLDSSSLEQVVAMMRSQSVPEFYNDFDFIQLCFRAEWLKSQILREKQSGISEMMLTELIRQA